MAGEGLDVAGEEGRRGWLGPGIEGRGWLGPGIEGHGWRGPGIEGLG